MEQTWIWADGMIPSLPGNESNIFPFVRKLVANQMETHTGEACQSSVILYCPSASQISISHTLIHMVESSGPRIVTARFLKYILQIGIETALPQLDYLGLDSSKYMKMFSKLHNKTSV